MDYEWMKLLNRWLLPGGVDKVLDKIAVEQFINELYTTRAEDLGGISQTRQIR